MRKASVLVALAFIAGYCAEEEKKPMPRVELQTSQGNIVVELDSVKAPKSVANFLGYVNEGFYDGTIFHRVIKGFMIQGGGFTSDMVRKKTKGPVQNEADNGLRNTRGTIAMARTNDPHSATSQFFINTVDNIALNHSSKSGQGWGYCVFGKVISGTKVVSAIEGVATTSRVPHRDVPVEPVVITKASLVEEAE